MNILKQILLGMLVAGIVAGTAIAATNAFFSDSATSAGNTFQAGKLQLLIDSKCSYNGYGSDQCGTWDAKKLTTEKFFNFSDIRPGDWGENTISFRIDNNPAWMCANLNITKNEALGKYLSVFWFADRDGDNIYDVDDKLLYNGPRTINGWLSLTKTASLPLTFADSYLNWLTWPGPTPPNTTPIPGNATQYLGVGWCFGTITLTPGTVPGFTCDGTADQNDSQGTSVVGDLKFDIQQYQNNPGFLCPEHQG